MADLLITVLVCFLLVVVFLYFFGKKEEGYYKDDDGNAVNESIFQGTVENYHQPESSDDKNVYDLLGNEYQKEAYEIGFGMGPGLYGSGRGNFEMVVQ